MILIKLNENNLTIWYIFIQNVYMFLRNLLKNNLKNKIQKNVFKNILYTFILFVFINEVNPKNEDSQ